MFSQHEELQKLIESAKNTHDAFTQQAEATLKRLEQKMESLTMPAKGDKGDMPIAGVHFPIPKDGKHGKDGETPSIDYGIIIKTVLKNIPTPKNGKDGESVNAEDIAKEIVKKKLIKGEHIDGYDATMKAFSRQLAGKIYGKDTLIRGGGDTVAAGSGVTITTDVNGKKVIAATGSGHTFVYNEVLGGSGTAFTFATAPIAGLYTIYGRGQKLIPTTDYSVVGTAVTTTGTWAAGDLIADSQHL